jgi:transcriptional regulator with XRE-family HTH domain
MKSEAFMALEEIFGANLRHYRKARGLKQPELAERVSLSLEMISKIERGVAAPSFPTIEKLADALGVPEAAFFGVGLVVTAEDERSRNLARIHVELSRLNNDQLARVDKALKALFV